MSDQPIDPSSNWAALLSLGAAFFLASTATAIDERYHYLWADDETSASYTPDPTYSHNSAGGDITCLFSLFVHGAADRPLESVDLAGQDTSCPPSR